MRFPIEMTHEEIEAETQANVKKISFKDYIEFKKRYFLGFMNPASPYFHQRFGQAFINEMMERPLVDSRLFYIRDDDEAERLILKKYITYE